MIDQLEYDIKGIISSDFHYALERAKRHNHDVTAETIREVMETSNTISQDLADAVKKNCLKWGDLVCDDLIDNVERIDKAQDMSVFNQVVNYGLARYALRVAIDGEDWIQGYMTEDVA